MSVWFWQCQCEFLMHVFICMLDCVRVCHLKYKICVRVLFKSKSLSQQFEVDFVGRIKFRHEFTSFTEQCSIQIHLFIARVVFVLKRWQIEIGCLRTVIYGCLRTVIYARMLTIWNAIYCGIQYVHSTKKKSHSDNDFDWAIASNENYSVLSQDRKRWCQSFHCAQKWTRNSCIGW